MLFRHLKCRSVYFVGWQIVIVSSLNKSEKTMKQIANIRLITALIEFGNLILTGHLSYEIISEIWLIGIPKT